MAAALTSMSTEHTDMVHDAQFDFYSRRLATCSSDKSVKIFAVGGSGGGGGDASQQPQQLLATLHGHDGPVWQLAWAHPKFGSVLASCGYDCRVVVWRNDGDDRAATDADAAGGWRKVHEYTGHDLSVNALSFAPHEFGLALAAASSDGTLSLLVHRGGDAFAEQRIPAHALGVNGVAWSPAVNLGSLVASEAPTQVPARRLASGGCDKLVKLWRETSDGGDGGGAATWTLEETLSGHSDWVRDVAWAPNIGLPASLIASAGQDKTVRLWQRAEGAATHTCTKVLQFTDVVWRVSFSPTGNILAVACGDQKVSLWKENVNGDWLCLSGVEEADGQIRVDERESR